QPSRNTAPAHHLGGGRGRSPEPRCAIRREATAVPAHTVNPRRVPPGPRSRASGRGMTPTTALLYSGAWVGAVASVPRAPTTAFAEYRARTPLRWWPRAVSGAALRNPP